KVRVNDADRSLDNVEDGTEANSPHVHSGEGHVVSSSSGGSGHLSFPKRNPDGDGAGSSLRRDAVSPTLFVPAWNLTTHSILNDAESCRDMMINLATPAQEHLGCAGQEADLVEKLVAVEKENDDLLDKNREREERIKDYTSLGHWRLDSSGASCVSGNIRRLAIGPWTHPERHAFQGIYVTWPLVLGLIRSVYVPGNLRHLAIGAWTHPGRLAFRGIYVTWPLALGLIWSVLHFGKYTSLSHLRLDSSRASCVPGNIRHLATGAWTNPGCRTLAGIKK
nr:hypothetical protein [Tanacetum cinerariifolium]